MVAIKPNLVCRMAAQEAGSGAWRRVVEALHHQPYVLGDRVDIRVSPNCLVRLIRSNTCMTTAGGGRVGGIAAEGPNGEKPKAEMSAGCRCQVIA